MPEKIQLRKARKNEAYEILGFYESVIKDIEGGEFKPKWSAAYPDLKFIEKSILKEELYLCSKNGIIACVVINNEFGEDYSNVKWHVDAESDEIIVIHTFAVGLMGKGIGKDILDYIVRKAIMNNKKTIRVDIIDGNVGAQRVFEKLGFEYVDSVKAFHESVGLQTFHLYEKPLKY